MGVQFLTRPDDKDGLYYKETPITISKYEENKIADTIKQEHIEMLHTNGWAKDKSIRYAGSIPWHIWFGKIQETGNWNYWRENNYYNAKQFFNDHTNMRVGEGYRKNK